MCREDSGISVGQEAVVGVESAAASRRGWPNGPTPGGGRASPASRGSRHAPAASEAAGLQRAAVLHGLDPLEHGGAGEDVREDEVADLGAADEDVLEVGHLSVARGERDAAQLDVHVVLHGRQRAAVDVAHVKLDRHHVRRRLVQQLDGDPHGHGAALVWGEGTGGGCSEGQRDKEQGDKEQRRGEDRSARGLFCGTSRPSGKFWRKGLNLWKSFREEPFLMGRLDGAT